MIDARASPHQDAFEHHRELCSTGVVFDRDTGQEIPEGGFDLTYVLIYMIQSRSTATR